MIISQEQAEITAALELISKSELKKVRLHLCQATLTAEESLLKGPFNLAESHTSRASAIVNRVLRVEVSFHFRSFDTSGEKLQLFDVECSFDLDYKLKADYEPSPASIEAFKNGNAVFNCWPYARELVQSITSRMDLNPPPLPFLRIIPRKAKPKGSPHPKPTSENDGGLQEKPIDPPPPRTD